MWYKRDRLYYRCVLKRTSSVSGEVIEPVGVFVPLEFEVNRPKAKEPQNEDKEKAQKGRHLN